MNRTDYFSAIKQQLTALTSQFSDGACLVVSIAIPGRRGTAGNICEVTLDNAARLLVEGTHRLASTEESHAFREEQQLKGAPNGDPLEAARRQFGLLIHKEDSNA
jgi:hypothetical protein